MSEHSTNNTNRNMANARVNKKDEFYTKLETIEEEVEHYKEQFENKVVYLNCDNPKYSNFFKYFVREFKNLKLKKLIASCYVEQDYNLFNLNTEKEKALYSVYNGEANGPEIKEMKGDGDFRSKESIELLKKADIVITNPPFSLFREYVSQLIEYDKKFLIIGNTNAITYKDFFNLIKENKVWAGHSFNKSIEFKLPNEYDKWDRIDEDTGDKYAVVPSISWWTNMDNSKRHELINLKENNHKNNYPKYCNFDAINIDKVNDIPYLYRGIMGVPITFIGKYNPEQFELLGLGAGTMYKELGGTPITQDFLDEYLMHGGTGNYVANQYILGYYDEHGKPVIPYMRVLIKSKCENEVEYNE